MVKEKRFGWAVSQALKYFNLKTGRLPGPIMGFLIPTYKCNSKCVMCNLASRADNKRKEMDAPGIKNIIDEFSDLRVSGINFTGGEPLLRDDIFDFIKYAKNKKFVVSLGTNGILLNEEKINRLLKAEPDNVNISLDASNGELFSKIRGVDPEIFDRIANSIKSLSDLKKRGKKKLAICIVTVISKYNIQDIDNIIRLAAEIGADKIGFTPLHDFSKGTISCKDDISINVDRLISESKNAHIEIDNTVRYLNMCNIAFGGGKFPEKCYSGPTSIIADCYGNVYPCWPFLELGVNVENTKSKTLKEVWHSPEYHQVRQGMKDCRACFWDCHSELNIFLNYL